MLEGWDGSPVFFTLGRSANQPPIRTTMIARLPNAILRSGLRKEVLPGTGAGTTGFCTTGGGPTGGTGGTARATGGAGGAVGRTAAARGAGLSTIGAPLVSRSTVC